ncbi:endonuclease, partial [Mediterraneibacter gnavus]
MEYRKKGIGGSDVAAIMGSLHLPLSGICFTTKQVCSRSFRRKSESNWLPRKSDTGWKIWGRNLFQKTGLE